MSRRCFNPFDPIQDTESLPGGYSSHRRDLVSTHSIRYRILKVLDRGKLTLTTTSFNPFDPIQDTESFAVSLQEVLDHRFQPIRSDTGY